MKLNQRIAQVRDGFLDILFPLHCVGCDREGSLICVDCRLDLPRIEPPWCFICGLPSEGRCVCGTDRSRIWSLDGIRSPFRFEGTIREAVHGLKYRNIRGLANVLAEHLVPYLQNREILADLLVPVPLHRKRLRQRGYNQSELIADRLSNLTGIPCQRNILSRERHTLPQARATDMQERRSNVADAFRAQSDLIVGQRILLLDDVTTTGATLEACASELKMAGAGSVWALTVAREL